jgi:hypothetical protein
METVCHMIGWKDTETVAGFLVRAAESKAPFGFTERLQFLYLLAFASEEFSLGMACVLSECEDDRIEVAEWLRSFMRGVDHRLESGLSEMEALSVEEKEFLGSAFKNTWEKSFGVEEPSLVTALLKLETMSHPSMIEDDLDDVEGGDQGEVMVDDTSGDSEDDDFWNKS